MTAAGHGQSEKRAGKYTGELFADDLAALLDRLGWPSATIAGCSMGGVVAIAFAAAIKPKTSARFEYAKYQQTCKPEAKNGYSGCLGENSPSCPRGYGWFRLMASAMASILFMLNSLCPQNASN
jgi:predicted acylesterase/phospholipase RssA